MANFFINDDALDALDAAGCKYAYALWAWSVAHVSRTSRLDITDAELRDAWDDPVIPADTVAGDLVTAGFWATTLDGWVVVANGLWALNEPEDYPADFAREVAAARICDNCPEINEALEVALTEVSTRRASPIGDVARDFFTLVHAVHS